MGVICEVKLEAWIIKGPVWSAEKFGFYLEAVASH